MDNSRISVLISGNGSNLQALIDACAASTIPHASIVEVLSNRKDVYGLQRATAAGIPTSYHNLLKYKREHPDLSESDARAGYDAQLAHAVLAARPHLVVLAGFMHVLAPTFLDPLKDVGVPVINLHPALRGEYNGKDALERAWADWEAGKTMRTGVMVHYVVREVDMGEPVLQREIAMQAGETFEEFVGRVHELEHPTLVEATRMVLEKIRRKD